MRIHIVARDFTSDQILARLAAQLSEHAAFTVGPMPDPNAELNYFAPYLEWANFRHFTNTKTSAWFSHHDIGRESKERLWEECAQAVDLRTTCTADYERELTQYGPTVRVTPPLDREMFCPTFQPQNERRVIGTSGFVYPGGRKGEHLIGRLMRDFPDCEFKASGAGWPCPTERLRWEDVPNFYRGLDVYVCTSSIEGIGYGPLEAMACGVPVVIPRGVGVFDDLPDLENLHRYDVGTYATLRAAVETALTRLEEGGYNPASLRGATARYSRDAWHESHVEAFEDFLYDVPRYIPDQEWRDKAGVYYVAYGDPARECAIRAIRSFKKYMPGIEVALVSESPLGAGEDFFIQHDDGDIGARGVKTQIYDLAPAHWQFVVYMDADTEVVGPVDFLFQLLADGWSAFFCTNPGKYCIGGEMRRPDNAEECNLTFSTVGAEEFLQLNGGVFGYSKNPNTEKFFRAWHQEWHRYGARDQAALDRVLYDNPIRVYVLGRTWNCITRYDPAEYGVVLHYPMQARRWRGRINGRLDSSEAWAATHPAREGEQ